MSDEIQSRPKSNFNCDVNSTFTGGMGENISLQNPFALLPEIFFFFLKIALNKIHILWPWERK